MFDLTPEEYAVVETMSDAEYESFRASKNGRLWIALGAVSAATYEEATAPSVARAEREARGNCPFCGALNARNGHACN